MNFPFNETTHLFYVQHRKAIESSLINGDLFYFTALEKLRYPGSYLFKFSKSYSALWLYVSNHIDIETVVNYFKVEIEQFYFLSKPIPIPKQFHFFSEKINQTQFVSHLCQSQLPLFDSSLVRMTLKRSHLQNKMQPLRSYHRKGKPFIEGYNDWSVLSLSRIAHELGHCVYEHNLSCLDWEAQIMSEIYACLVEELITNDYLKYRSNAKKKWKQYQKNISYLNIHFFLCENNYFRSRVGHILDVFDNQSSILRESLYTIPGYQIAYALASMLKLKLVVPDKQMLRLLPKLENLIPLLAYYHDNIEN